MCFPHKLQVMILNCIFTLPQICWHSIYFAKIPCEPFSLLFLSSSLPFLLFSAKDYISQKSKLQRLRFRLSGVLPSSSEAQ